MMPGEELEAWVVRSTAASGVPLRLEDPSLCEHVADLIRPMRTTADDRPRARTLAR